MPRLFVPHWRFLIRQSHHERQRRVQPCDLLDIPPADRAAHAGAPNRHRFVGDDL
jgi:hypothetical protein